MNKKDLIVVQLPKVYVDCSDWFKEGVDTLPDLKDFILSGRTKKDYDKLMKLYCIENLKSCIVDVTTDKEKENVLNLIKDYIEQYNTM